MSVKQIMSYLRITSYLRILFLIVAVASGPLWFGYAAYGQPGSQQCNYNCGLGGFSHCYYYYASGCGAGGGGLCKVTICGTTCYNKAGQACSPGTTPPPNCSSGAYQIEVCYLNCHDIPCGCDNFCSH